MGEVDLEVPHQKNIFLEYKGGEYSWFLDVEEATEAETSSYAVDK